LRVSRSICTLGLCCVLLGACAETARDGPEGYVVRPEDTLYSIAWRHDLDYRDLARWNHIGTDFRILVGQVLVLGPGGAASPERGAPRAVPKPPPAPRPAPAFRPTPTPQAGKPRPLPESQSGAPNVIKWAWPTDRVGAPLPVPGGGIFLSGRLGQDVRAASAGRVVYTGSGLRGYGNLIIIKHGDSLLSAYAHNREMLVHDGQDVIMGQVIGHMGEGPHQSPVLYFEIRQNGRPIDPLPFLSSVK
jgi:lipoprotein NlpD